jgi:hypothetical protein
LGQFSFNQIYAIYAENINKHEIKKGRLRLLVYEYEISILVQRKKKASTLARYLHFIFFFNLFMGYLFT